MILPTHTLSLTPPSMAGLLFSCSLLGSDRDIAGLKKLRLPPPTYPKQCWRGGYMHATQAHFEERDKRRRRNSVKLVSIQESCAQQCRLMKLVAQLVLSSKFCYCLVFLSLWNGTLGTSCPKLPVYFVSDINDQGCGWFWFDNCVVKSYSKASFLSSIFRLKCLKRGFCSAAELDTVVVDPCKRKM